MDKSSNELTYITKHNKKRYAVLVLDMLNDFVDGKLKCERAKEIIPNIKDLIHKIRQKGIPIFYCNDEHLPEDTELKLWGPHAMKGSLGAQIIDDLRPIETDHVIPKRTYSGFQNTGLDRALKDAYNGNGAEAVIITGLHTHICAILTAYDAFARGFDIIVAEDGVNAFTEEDHKFGLDYMKQNYGAKIMKTSEILKLLDT